MADSVARQLATSSASPTEHSRSTPNRLREVTPFDAAWLALALAASARVLDDAVAGAALHRDGSPRPLPGLPGDGLLAEDSPVTSLSCAYLADEQRFTSFLWPRGDPGVLEDYVQVTVIGCPPEAPAELLGAVALTPVHDVRGLTPRELHVLGVVMEGLSNQQIARQLTVTPRTVATHVEHILTKLDAPTRTVAAVRAERRGLYVPPYPARRHR